MAAASYCTPPNPLPQPMEGRSKPRPNRRPGPPKDTYHTYVVMEGAEIRTTVTSSPDQVANFIKEITRGHRRHEGEGGLIVGIDTEWRECGRNERGGKCYKVAVLQLCVSHRCLVFKLSRAGKYPPELADFLADPAVRFVGVGVDGDVKRLAEDCNLQVANAVDLGKAAATVLDQPELRRAGLKSLALTVMGAQMEKSKKITMSNWHAQMLTRQQINYACIDAYVSFEIGRRLLTGESLPATQL
uniref:3'-5' exonuclease domain-containing protein n=1 Tax=Leersia perrieri TaxID=77586 RepID=A0A0D9V3R7_9ORYZ